MESSAGPGRPAPSAAALAQSALNASKISSKAAGVPGRAHGLRKAGATIAANNGATAHQLMGIFGWDTLKMAEKYTRAADQQRLAATAMHMLAYRHSGDSAR